MTIKVGKAATSKPHAKPKATVVPTTAMSVPPAVVFSPGLRVPERLCASSSSRATAILRVAAVPKPYATITAMTQP